MAKTHTYNIGPITGYGRSRSEARDDAERQAAEILSDPWVDQAFLYPSSYARRSKASMDASEPYEGFSNWYTCEVVKWLTWQQDTFQAIGSRRHELGRPLAADDARQLYADFYLNGDPESVLDVINWEEVADSINTARCRFCRAQPRFVEAVAHA